jgi:Phospholipase_D-nuclease N-terminal/Short C-terminal domain
MVLAADYPFLDVLWTMIVFFVWVSWFWLVITVAADVFRRRDIGGGKKTLWLLFILFVPLIGVFAYMIAHADDLADRQARATEAQRAETDDYIRSVAGGDGAAAEIEKAKRLLDSGAITEVEFEAIKAKALA